MIWAAGQHEFTGLSGQHVHINSSDSAVTTLPSVLVEASSSKPAQNGADAQNISKLCYPLRYGVTASSPATSDPYFLVP